MLPTRLMLNNPRVLLKNVTFRNTLGSVTVTTHVQHFPSKVNTLGVQNP